MKISEMITDRYKLRIPPTVYYELLADIRNEQEPQTFKWCTDCKEYDQEKHCCHRWSKVIRNTVEDLKQEYIEREVLDEIRAEVEQTVSRYSISRERGGMGQVEWSDRLIKESEVLKILDRYKAETEET